MKLWRAILFGILLWILIFFEVSILMFGLNLTEGVTYYVIHYILLILFSVFVAVLYFRNDVGGFLNGIVVGLMFLITGIILDVIITVPLFVKDYGFFLDLFLWVGFILGVLIAGLVGALKKK